jgi:ribosomal protein S18 acetylase RimI-like enzyme
VVDARSPEGGKADLAALRMASSRRGRRGRGIRAPCAALPNRSSVRYAARQTGDRAAVHPRPAPPPPLAVAVREARPDDAAALWRVQIATTDTTFRGCVSDEVYARMCARVRRANPWPRWLARSDSFTLVAEVDAASGEGEAGVVAYATAGRPRPDPPGWDGELFLLYVLRPYQRRGLGRRLVAAAAARLAAQGRRSLVVWSLATNWPSRRFYEALGARFVEARRITEADGTGLDIAIYGWPDTRPLLDPPADGGG